MKFIRGNNDHEIVLIDSEENVLGKGYIYEGLASKLYEKDRVNYFIEVVVEVDDKDYKIRRLIVDELVKNAKERRKNYSDYDARVYHCCFSNDQEKIKFYSLIKGFKHDEGMHILTHNLKYISNKISNKLEYEIKEDTLNTEEEIRAFINEHSKIFRNHSYSVDGIRKLKEKEGFKNIAIYDNGHMIGNIFLMVNEETGLKFGLVEDLFVKEGFRNQRLGEILVNRALEYFKTLDLHESRLEVWSANERAINLYNKVGYKFMKEIESSIGMYI